MLALKTNRVIRISRERCFVLGNLLTSIITKKLRRKTVTHQQNCYVKQIKNKANTEKQQLKNIFSLWLLYYTGSTLLSIKVPGDFALEEIKAQRNQATCPNSANGGFVFQKSVSNVSGSVMRL